MTLEQFLLISFSVSVIAWASFWIIVKLLAKDVDPEILQNKHLSSGGNLRLYDGGYSGTHEKYEAKKLEKAMSEVFDDKKL